MIYQFKAYYLEAAQYFLIWKDDSQKLSSRIHSDITSTVAQFKTPVINWVSDMMVKKKILSVELQFIVTI